MIYEKIWLEEEHTGAFLEVFAAEKVGDFVRNAILVIPGGGYTNVCADREGEPIAMAFMPYGYNAFVLHYSVEKAKFPDHLIQASKAMKYIKDHAERYNINPDRVFTVGFSAGGHLAATLGTMWNREEVYQAAPMPYGYNKPAGMMLIYPVISGKEFRHAGSFQNLLKTENPTREQLDAVSIENVICEESSPAYIMHTSNDQCVHVKNSLVLADALASKGITFELHIYPDAPHGVALGNEITKCDTEKWCNPAIAKWVEQAVAWAKNV
ncbi:MAG: alpha/beta hydrolase [Clostridia bacterium]|nr:alpha/beta hydrolase [Clostridia bacterium]